MTDIQESKDRQQQVIREKSCYMMGSHISVQDLSDQQIISADKKQYDTVEQGFRLLKYLYFFASLFFIKKPSRSIALVMIMTLSLFAYAIAQRRRQSAIKKEILPHQIN